MFHVWFWLPAMRRGELVSVCEAGGRGRKDIRRIFVKEKPDKKKKNKKKSKLCLTTCKNRLF